MSGLSSAAVLAWPHEAVATSDYWKPVFYLPHETPWSAGFSMPITDAACGVDADSVDT